MGCIDWYSARKLDRDSVFRQKVRYCQDSLFDWYEGIVQEN